MMRFRLVAGDVDHTREGRFQHLFNIFLPANDPSIRTMGFQSTADRSNLVCQIIST
jgi:hypothetical protein